MNALIDKLLPYERDLFFAINGSESVFWDNAMWTYTGLLTWMPMLVFILYISFRSQMLKEGLLVLVALAVVILFADQLSSSVIKPFFKRFRPTHHPDFMLLVDTVKGYKGGQYGFISGHATNSFGLAVFFTLLFKNKYVTGFIIFWAILNSYSRIYLGVHFISDIIAGFFLGSLIGFLVYELYAYARVKLFKIPPRDKRKSIYSKREGNILGIAIITYMTLIILLSSVLTSVSHSIIPKAWH